MLQRPAARLYHFLWIALDWVFPPRCGGCDQFGVRWCTNCQEQIILLPEKICPICGIPQSSGIVCAECTNQRPAYQTLRSIGYYSGPLRKAIIRLKYSRDLGLGEALAGHLYSNLSDLNWQIDLVTSVPLSKGRLRQRGYNQAAALARPVAMAIQKRFQPVLLRKTREAPSQVGLSANERRKNVDGAFVAGKIEPCARRILVIDDVTTTGSTMNACARALLAAGAEAVYGLTLARAGLHDPIPVS